MPQFPCLGGREAFLTFGPEFLWSTEWDAVNHKFGALVPIYGTLVTALIAMVIAVPVSLGIAVYLTEVAPPWLRTPIGSAIELLAGIPSIIYGMWGLFVFVPFMGEHITPWLNDNSVSGRCSVAVHRPTARIGMLTAGIVLAIMVTCRLIRDARRCSDCADAPKESAYALARRRPK